MAARRRVGSFSPKTSRRFRISKFDMLLDMAPLLNSFRPRIIVRRVVITLTSTDAILTTVNYDCLTGDKCGIVACQKEYCTCDILRFSQSLNRLLFPGAAFLLFGLGRDCLCIR